MGVRARKNHLILALKTRARLCRSLTPEQVAQFELMYRRAVTVEEQDQVSKVVNDFIDGWRTGTDVYSRLQQDRFEEDDDPLPPVLQAAWERSQELLKKP